jgi:hypothetical protein
MLSAVRIWFRHLLTPKIYRMKVLLFENGRHVEAANYTERKLLSLVDSIDNLCEKFPPPGAQYWFVTEAIEEREGLFGRKHFELYVACYREKHDSVVKTREIIPHALRKKLFDNFFEIYPRLPSGKLLAEKVEVKFLEDKT